MTWTKKELGKEGKTKRNWVSWAYVYSWNFELMRAYRRVGKNEPEYAIELPIRENCKDDDCYKAKFQQIQHT